ncbi:MAG: site-2 protease family protein [Planctomycetes bacterium]|nr:site-2 protease family protein [Planctomycetota bacterium]
MGTFDNEWLMRQVVVLPPLLLSLTLHEFAHARVALAFGDRTALLRGRVSLNPLRHLDPMGTLMLVFSGLIGWAKPVPVNPMNFHHRRLGEMLVSAAGPLTNLALAVISAMLLVILRKIAGDTQGLLVGKKMLFVAAQCNLALCFFNLLPLFPLDGHHIVREMLPSGSREVFMRWQIRFGSRTLMILVVALQIIEIATGRASPVNPLRLYLAHVIFPILDLMGV